MSTFSDDELRAAMENHRPGNEGDCLCSWGIGANKDQQVTADHLIEVMQRARQEVRT